MEDIKRDFPYEVKISNATQIDDKSLNLCISAAKSLQGVVKEIFGVK